MSMEIDSDSKYIEVADNAALGGFSAMTLCGWIFPTANAGTNWGRMLTKTNGSTGDDYHIGIRGSTFEAVCRLTTSDHTTTLTGTTVLSNNDVKHNICMTWDGTTVRLLLDGVEEDSDTNTGTINDANEHIGIGRHPDSTTRDVKARVEDIRIYNRALVLPEAKHMFGCEGTDGIHEGIIANWRMNEKGGGVAAGGAGSVIDIVGGFNGTPNGSPDYGDSDLKFRRRVA